MRRLVFASTLVLMAMITGGCIISIGSGKHKNPHEQHPHHDPDIVISEIDAAGRLFSDRDKADVYKDIAQRPQLPSKAQVHLVKETFAKLFADPPKEEVVLLLINNPCFDDAGKKAILSRINRLFSDTSKKRILKAFSDKQKQIAEAKNIEPPAEQKNETVEN